MTYNSISKINYLKIFFISELIVLFRRRKRIYIQFFFIFLSIFVFCSFSQARVKSIPIEEVFDVADFIIRGTVIDSNTRWGNKKIMIFTDYTIEVLENIKGDSTSEITMSFAGGTVGDKSIFVSDTPILKVGEEYIICGYDSNKKYAVPVVGGYQGIFRVIHDEAKNLNIMTDYNGYRLEVTEEHRVIKGPLIKKDSSGVVIVKEDLIFEKKEPPLSPTDRDAAGNILPKVVRTYKDPKKHLQGEPFTKNSFTDFIKTVIK